MSSWGPFERAPNVLVIMTDQQRSVQHWPAGWAEKHLPALTELQAGLPDWEELPELRELLEESFLQDDQDRWFIPDPKKSVETIDIVSAMGKTIPIIVAITAERYAGETKKVGVRIGVFDMKLPNTWGPAGVSAKPNSTTPS